MKKLFYLIFLFFLPILAYSQSLIPVEVHGKWGAINSFGKMVIQPCADCEINVCGDHDQFALIEDRHSGIMQNLLVNIKGEVIVSKKDTSLQWVGNGLLKYTIYATGEKPQSGLMDTLGHFITPAKFLYIREYNEGYAYAEYIENPKWDAAFARAGIINTKGEWVIKPDYLLNGLGSYSDGLIVFSNDNGTHWGAIDINGKIVIPGIYKNLGTCKNGYVGFGTKTKMAGLMTATGQIVIPEDTGKSLYYFPEGPMDTLVLIYRLKHYNGGGCIIGKVLETDPEIYTVHGKLLFNSPYTNTSTELNGVFKVSNGSGFFGLMNAKGETIAKQEYITIETGEPGLMRVEFRTRKWGYMDHKGKIVIPCRYHSTSIFKSGFAWVSKTHHARSGEKDNFHGENMVINKKGHVIWRLAEP